MPQSNGSASDCNLLLGVLAVQLHFITCDALVAAIQAWAPDKSKSLGQILVEQGKLSAGQLQVLESALAQHLHAHGNDAESSLFALAEASSVRTILMTIEDEDVPSTIANFGTKRNGESTAAHHAPSMNGGRYHRLRSHARGGLGEVFVAEDTELHREVALKEIRAEHADEPDSRGRFVLEAEITGGLEHPGIVPVYGLGWYTNGRPYYAMRFIRGDRLKDAIERFHAADKPGRDAGERSLAFRHLLRRYVDVCNAVAYAHSRGVVHRDLKPSNVMLGKFGETLVVDWGLAKAGIKDLLFETRASKPVDEERTLRPNSGSSYEKTQAGSLLGTAHYMSPEQAAGRLNDLGPASDIFSLGSTLYVLLTGAKPFQGDDDSEVLANVRSCEFVPPCARKPGTPPALGAICLKAMAREPWDRYASALDFAADIEHWLADEPVAVYAAPWTARLGRWVRRHRTPVAGAAAFLISAVIALSLSTALIWAEQQKTAEQKDIAVQHLGLAIAEQKKTAEQKEIAHGNYVLARDAAFNSIDLIESNQVVLASNPAWHKKRRDILVTATRNCRRFLLEEPDDPILRTRAAQVFRYTANFHRLENDSAAAAPLIRTSITLQEKLVKQFDEPARLDNLAAALRDEATLFALRGQLTKAAVNYERALAIAAKLRQDHPAESNHDRTRAITELDFAAIQDARGNTKESLELARSAADLFGQLADVPIEKKHGYDPLLRAAALTRIAALERDTDVKQARKTHNDAVKILKAMVDEKPANVVDADIYHHQARCRVEQALTLALVPEKRADAEKNLAAAALQWQQLSKNYPEVPQYRSARAHASLTLGRMRAEDKRTDEAEADFQLACELLEPLVEKFAATPSYHAELGRAHAELGRLARIKKDQEGAAANFEKAEGALNRAAELSPQDRHIQKSREEIRAERIR